MEEGCRVAVTEKQWPTLRDPFGHQMAGEVIARDPEKLLAQIWMHSMNRDELFFGNLDKTYK